MLGLSYLDGGPIRTWATASAAAPGQPPLAALLDELRAGEVSAEPGLFALVGAPPARSPSPALHNSVFRAEARDAQYVAARDLSLEDALQFEGVRERVEDHLQMLEKTAKEIIDRIITGYRHVPYGVRWICKQLGELSRARYPGITDLQVT